MLRRNQAKPVPAEISAVAEQSQPVPAAPRKLTKEQMNVAIEQGLAASPLVRQDILRYDGAWWQASSRGWLEYTDAAAVATLDRRSIGITGQQEIALRNANIRAAFRGAEGTRP